MDALTNPALWTAIAALIGAIGGVVAVFRHKNDPQAHGQTTQQPFSPTPPPPNHTT